MKLSLMSIAVGVIAIACNGGSDETPEGEDTALTIENSTAPLVAAYTPVFMDISQAARPR